MAEVASLRALFTQQSSKVTGDLAKLKAESEETMVEKIIPLENPDTASAAD